MKKTLEERFWSKVNKRGPILKHRLGRCWEWTGAQDGRGRGSIWLYGDKPKAPRVAWFLETGMWPNPEALHKCDNPLCVRFSHLFEGTQLDNMQDAAKKGRIKWTAHHGSDNGRAKLSEGDVTNIKLELKNGSTGKSLSVKYGVDPGIISGINTGKRWRHVQ